MIEWVKWQDIWWKQYRHPMADVAVVSVALGRVTWWKVISEQDVRDFGTWLIPAARSELREFVLRDFYGDPED